MTPMQAMLIAVLIGLSPGIYIAIGVVALYAKHVLGARGKRQTCAPAVSADVGSTLR